MKIGIDELPHCRHQEKNSNQGIDCPSPGVVYFQAFDSDQNDNNHQNIKYLFTPGRGIYIYIRYTKKQEDQRQKEINKIMLIF